MQALGERTSRLDILVNNAGAAWGAPYEAFPESGFRKVLELNVTALFFLTRDLTPLLAAAATPDDPARIINIGSMDGLRAPTILENGTFPYSASKAAVHHLTRSLALELAPRHVTVNAVAPGFFPSRMTEATLETFGDEIVRRCPLRRIGRPEDMAGVAIYLASRAGAYTTGGGHTRRRRDVDSVAGVVGSRPKREDIRRGHPRRAHRDSQSHASRAAIRQAPGDHADR